MAVATEENEAGPGCRLILPHDLRGRSSDGPVAVGYHEITVSDSGRSSVHADEDVHSVAILPQLPNLDQVKVVRLTQGVEEVFADGGAAPLPLLLLLVGGLLVLLFRWHRFSR
jgi:hypothetical protein